MFHRGRSLGREGRGHSRGRGRGGRGRGRGGRSSKAGNNATIGIPSPYSIYIPREKCTVDNCANPPIAKYLEELANDDSALENVRSSARNALASVLKYPNKIRSKRMLLNSMESAQRCPALLFKLFKVAAMTG